MVSAYRVTYLISSAFLFGAALLAVLALVRLWLGLPSEALHPMEQAVQIALVVVYAGLGPRVSGRSRGIVSVVLAALLLVQIANWGGEVLALEGALAVATGPAAMLALLAIAALLFMQEKGVLAQMLVMVAVLLALMAVISEVFEVPTVQAPNSILSAGSGLMLALGAFLRNANRGFLRVLLSRQLLGQQVRYLLLSAILGPLVIGLVFTQIFSESLPAGAVFDMIWILILFQALMIAGGAYVAAQQDRTRRRLERKLHDLALHDGLTGVLNRASFDERFKRFQKRADLIGEAFSLVLVDVDYFKKINDRAGHACGDEVLRELAQIMAGGLRSDDVLARIGGEEFAILLGGADGAVACEVAERLRQAIAAHGWSHPDLRDMQITASFGVAQWQEGEGVRHLLDRADQALYGSKDQGRNRVTTAALSM
ncbi:GGDEF domain-containing protein [Thioclava sp. A2]|uniref:GGDEF domain-containing protein n=1 Tax=Thioclava sp. FCG-A2 TaxID=3080562 RepID=UPI0029552CEB|nr:GGDEF domain-containing protein [Thioclava sp. A2]MDV7269997.1 GGDEF domain-containing protein [Thioclava sp. A2]